MRLIFEQRLEVKKTGFGMGVFLTEPAREGDLIAGIDPVSFLSCTPCFTTAQSTLGSSSSSRRSLLEGKLCDICHRERSNIRSPSYSALERHRGRNYVYGLNQSFSIDGTYVGNETRFINHAPKQKANGKVASEYARDSCQQSADVSQYFW